MTEVPFRLDKTTSRSNRQQRKFPGFVAKIRQCGCLICGGQAEAAHLRLSSAVHNKSNGRSDVWVNPLCPGHHRLYPDCQHSGSEYDFWQRHGIDPLEIAQKLWNARDDLQKMQAICTDVLLK